MRYVTLLLLLLSITACKEPQPRKPVTVKSGFSREYSVQVERTKKILQLENDAITNYINNDSTNSYLNSNKGFKYCYIKKDSVNTYRPRYGDGLLYTYSVTDIHNNTVYTTSEIGDKSYYIDQESKIIEGLRQGLKLIKVGEEMKFIFPSQLAYGYRGDGKKINANLPIICTVTLKELVTKESLNRTTK
jgi:gliding motility-associated peptidyl-prolyl isomerase